MAAKRLKKIHLLFKTHLDVGYTDYAAKVKEKYFRDYFPKALKTAQTLRWRGMDERFVWTIGAWPVYEYLLEAKGKDRKVMEAALKRGDITWHGLPFTVHSELMDLGLFNFGLGMSKELDRRFGKRTIAAKLTDVPSHTRGIVPLLAKAGIRLLHIGVNPTSTPPAVPSAFVWRHTDGSEIIVIYQKGEYGGLTILPGMDEALLFCHTNDNLGPQSSDNVRAIFHDLKLRYPGVKIVASTLDEYARAVLRQKPKLPVLTAEFGDSWIYGVGTDPTKVRRYLVLRRLRSQWLKDGTAKRLGNRFRDFSRQLIMVPEHTWGLDEKTYLADYRNFSARDFREARKQPHFKAFEKSWAEQRAYVDDAVKALGNTAAGRLAKKKLRESEPRIPKKAGFKKVADPNQAFNTAHFTVRFDPATGAVVQLRDRNKDWAGKANPLGQYTYELFCQADYDRYLRQYVYGGLRHWWPADDFAKPGMAYASQRHREWKPRLKCLWMREDSKGTRFIAELAMPKECVRDYGAPALLFLEYGFPKDRKEVLVDFQWFRKNACRLPEASWLSFCPKVSSSRGWLMEKLGQLISPFEVIRDGNRKMHAVNGLRYVSKDEDRLFIRNIDSPLAAPGERSLLDFNNRQPQLKKGWHFNLHNNLWGTNFPMWFEDDCRSRFVYSFGHSPRSGCFAALHPFVQREP